MTERNPNKNKGEAPKGKFAKGKSFGVENELMEILTGEPILASEPLAPKLGRIVGKQRISTSTSVKEDSLPKKSGVGI